ncbi:nitrile hydratase subunit alpha [Pelagibius litoralis]|uniref:Nitrile hydratase subunit alpha n=1 Tax=Pelagibius litoralis TaxID=374515 RepID=A0A967C5V3_9PROT|nr:nitrile hydratase subunit alpha [Pelagibius litoralis]NIA69120.1 nitrile hydratase subunit alpha [Pelagibius litoralis]
MAEDHTHDHPHDHSQFQPDLEDKPLTHYQAMTEAVGELLIEKGVISGDELRAMLELIDAKSPAAGAKMVARAWVDSAFKARMMDDVLAAAEELGIDAGGIPILAVENTPEVHNVIVCTLCSCYPRQLIGLPPDWYKARSYRSRTVCEPRKVLAEFGTVIPDDVEVRVHDSTADLRYMVIPQRPAGSEGLDEAALADLVTRDCMIGVTLAKAVG